MTHNLFTAATKARHLTNGFLLYIVRNPEFEGDNELILNFSAVENSLLLSSVSAEIQLSILDKRMDFLEHRTLGSHSLVGVCALLGSAKSEECGKEVPICVGSPETFLYSLRQGANITGSFNEGIISFNIP